MSDDLIMPKAGMGHPDPNHPSNKYKGGDAYLYDYEGRPIVSKGRWGGQGTNLWLFITMSKQSVGLRAPADGMKEPEVFRHGIGGVNWTIGVSEGRPVFLSSVFGQCLELPGDLARDDLKKQYIMDWIKDTAIECMVEAMDTIGFTGLHSPDMFAKWLQESANTAIKRMGL